MAEEDFEFENENAKFNFGKEKKQRKKDRSKKKLGTKDNTRIEKEDEAIAIHSKGSFSKDEAGQKFSGVKEESVKRKKMKALSRENDDQLDEGKRDKKMNKVENRTSNAAKEENAEESDEKEDKRKRKLKTRLLKEAAEADRRGICYMSRVPPQMDPIKLRQLLSQYGEIQRIYLAPENPSSQVRRKPGGRRQDLRFSEGWIEFSDKRVAKRVADMLNGEQIGGKKRSSLYYDLWNIKYLSKFKWDDLTEEIAYKHAVREQKLSLEISAAKRERDFYLSKVDKARALSSIEERLKKKQKLQDESGTSADIPVSPQAPKVIRKFPQNKPVTDTATQNKPRLSKDILAGVFGDSTL